MMGLLKVARIATGNKLTALWTWPVMLVCIGRLPPLRTGRRLTYPHGKKHRRPVPKTCDPNLCDHCMYLGEGDFVCDLYGLGPEETVFVHEDWEPTIFSYKDMEEIMNRHPAAS